MSFFRDLISMVSSYIQFEDVNTKESLINNSAINIDGDHEISYKEAAAYNTSPVTINVTGETFKEFQYFTGLRVGKIVGQNLTTIYIPPLFQGSSTIRMLEGCPNLTTIGIFGPLLGYNANTFGTKHKVNKVIVFNEPMDILNSIPSNLGWFGSSNSTGKFYDKNNNEISSITVTNNINIESGILMKCISIHSIDCNNKVSQVKDRAFYQSSLQNITNTSSITAIGIEAFSESNLGSITANLVTKLTGSFASCLNLTEVHLQAVTTLNPSTIKDRGCFTGDSNLVIVDMPALQTIGSKGFKGCTKLVSLNTTVLTTVGEQAFYDCSNFETLDTSTITTIAASAFRNCVKFNIKNFNNTTSLASAAFSGCIALTEIELKNNNLTTIGDGAFQGCTALTKIDAPNLINIGKRTFYGCTELVNANIDWNNITNIKDEAFAYCSSLSLTDWTIPDSLVEIGSSAFAYSNISGTLTIPSTSSLTKLSFSIFRNSKISSIIINNPNITTIPSNCFYNCSQITYVNAPYITEIGTDALGCDIPCLNRIIDLPVLKKASVRAFRKVSGTLNIPNIEEIGQYCFLDSDVNATITPSKLKIISNAARLRTNAFEFSSLIKISGLGMLNSNSYIILSNETFPDGQSIVEYSPYITGNGSINYIQPVCDSANSPITSSLRIVYVPDSLLSLYLADTNWSTMCNRTGIQIKAISELNS